MKGSPAFQFYPQDFLSDENVTLMTLEERGAYITLLSYCWIEGSLPIEVDKLAKLCGVDAMAMQKLCGVVIPLFYKRKNRYYHSRLDEERKKQFDHSQTMRENANKRWNKEKQQILKPCNGNAKALHRQSKSNALQFSSSTSVYKETLPTLEEAKSYLKDLGCTESDGEEFWLHYESQNWMRGKTRIQKWRVAAAQWKRRIPQFNKGKNNGKSNGNGRIQTTTPGEGYDAYEQKTAVSAIP